MAFYFLMQQNNEMIEDTSGFKKDLVTIIQCNQKGKIHGKNIFTWSKSVKNYILGEGGRLYFLSPSFPIEETVFFKTHDTCEVICIRCKDTKHTLVYLKHVLKIIKYVDSTDSPENPLDQMNIHFSRCSYLVEIHF